MSGKITAAATTDEKYRVFATFIVTYYTFPLVASSLL
jgi:hypothetical protein